MSEFTGILSVEKSVEHHKGIIFEILKEKIWKGKTALRISRLLSILEDNYGSIIDENFKTALV